jgi:DNA processing protein
LILFYRGNIKVLQMPGIAIIGTREPTEAGTQAGIYFAEKFAEQGFNIVSGLAIGCDTTGHQGALNVKGATTAFLANGLDWESIYPKENLELAKNIVESGGLLLSEYPVGQRGNRYTLVERDRLQAGLSYATIVIQTGLRGGTMHAVNATLKARKPLFMIKYKNMDGQVGGKAEGNKKFLEEGKAHALTSGSFEDALAVIRESVEKNNKPKIKDSLF